MINTPQKTAKTGSNKFIKAIALIGTTLLITLNINANPSSKAVQNEIKEVLKKNPGKEVVVKMDNNKAVEKAAKFEMTPDDTINALDFATQNVDQYYPDMKEHLTTMINSFRDEEHREATTKLLNEMIVNIEDPVQKTGAIIYVLERRVFSKSDFAKKYDSQITDVTFDQMDIFRVEYKKRFDVYYANLLANIEQLKTEIKQKEEEIKQKEEEIKQKDEEIKQKDEEIKQKDEEIKQKDEEIKQKDEEIKQKDEEIKQGLKDLENILSKFTPEDVKTNSAIKELTINTEKFYQEGGFPISEHLQNLFDATK